MRAAKNWAKRRLKDGFEIGQRLGVDILPRHFYSSIPDMRQLRSETEWQQPFEMFGVVGADISSQLAFLADMCRPFAARWPELAVYAAAEAENGQGGGYGPIEAEVLHAFILRHQPKKIVQIGCGVSTSVILRAAGLAGYRPELVCIEPYPSAFLMRAAAARRITLVKERAQSVRRDVLTNLASGDLIFVDSTHSVAPGSEVNRIILDVLPRLGAGVFVHFHDIHFPYDYQRGLLAEEMFFSLESTLLHAFLIGNARFGIAVSMSMLHYAAPEAISELLPHFDPQAGSNGLRRPGGSHFPSATYLLATADPAAREHA
jgi:predicted O-methyltransferase YrrM